MDLLLPFSLSLLTALFATLFFPSLRFFAFAPFLALLFMRTSFVKALWLSACCGVIIDLFSVQMRFGAVSLNYTLTALFLYHQKRHFFDDKPLALSCFTALISAVSTTLHLFFSHLFDAPLPVTWKFFLVDTVGMALVDGAFAFLCFTCPAKVYSYIKTIWPRKSSTE